MPAGERIPVSRYNRQMFFSTLLKTLPQQSPLRTLLLMRLVALACLALAMAVAVSWLGIALPLLPMTSVIAILLIFNLWAWRRARRPGSRPDADVFLQLLIDIAGLSVMLYFSGGATNPFASFYLPVLAAAAAMLPRHLALILSCCAIGAYSILTGSYVPLHLGDPDRAISYHLAGMWATFAISAALITWYVAALANTVRQRDAQLAQARVQHSENERLLALGIQAANAAHALGTPLSTIAIIVAELRHEVGTLQANSEATAPSFLDEELATIETQVSLCKSALDRMGTEYPAAMPDGASGDQSLAQWFFSFLDQWRLRYPATRLRYNISAVSVHCDKQEVLAQILTTLLDNAAQAVAQSDATVTVSLAEEAQHAVFCVRDDGAGIPAELLPQLGQQQVASRSNGRGIGLFLAFAAARRIGASIRLESKAGHGACATLHLPP
jgi:two-component system sensor histidine kinase RegB